MKVIKRDGREVKFNESKIHDAIISAAIANNKALEENDLANITNTVISKIQKQKTEYVTVEEIQDFVIETLGEKGYTQLAKRYASYRAERNKVRERNSKLMNVFDKIGVQTDRDNANVGNNFSAKLLRIASEGNK